MKDESDEETHQIEIPSCLIHPSSFCPLPPPHLSLIPLSRVFQIC